jgi:hypothetical protein
MSRGRREHRIDPYFFGLGSFAAIVAAFVLLGATAGIRMLGIVLFAQGIYFVLRRRIPYGWEGQEPSGYLTGWVAIGLGILSGAAGASAVVWPQVFVIMFT